MSDTSRTIKIGTRGSPLALYQANLVKSELNKKFPNLKAELQIIKTSGDWRPEQGEARLNEDKGGKAQFAKEIEDALLAGAIDCAVHSMKDMESVLPKGLAIFHMLKREDPRDAVLVHKKTSTQTIQRLEDLPPHALIGTASPRREAILRQKRPDFKTTVLRGNIQTRIDKLKNGQVDATLLAVAGLKRLGLEHEIEFILEPEDMLPCAGQGAIGIEIREDRKDELSIFSQISCENTITCVSAERAVLESFEGSCHTSAGIFATLNGHEMHIRALFVAPDLKQFFVQERCMSVKTLEESIALGKELGERLKKAVGKGF